MLQKLENLYLGILRLVVLLAAGILLASVLYYSVQSLKMFKSPPPTAAESPKVAEPDLKKQVLSAKEDEEAQNKADEDSAATKKSDASEQSPKDKALDKAADAIVAFIKAHADGKEEASKEDVISVLNTRIESLDDQALDTAFAVAYQGSVETLLQDKDVIAAAKAKSPLRLINAHLGAFTEAFEKDAKRLQEQSHARDAEYEIGRHEGQQAAYIAGGAFAAFLSLVFLSIFIRIERNLRHLERLSPPAKG